MSQINTLDSGSFMAGHEDRTPPQTPFHLTPGMNTATTEPSALVDNEVNIEQPEADREELDSGGSPNSNSTPATSEWKESSSFATHASTSISPLYSSQPLSGAAHAGYSGVVSEFTGPSSSALFPAPLNMDRKAREPSEQSESAFSGGVARSRGLKRSLELSESSDKDDEPPTKHKRARTTEPSTSQEDVIPSGSTLFPVPESLEHSESAIPGDAARSQGPKYPREANDSSDEDDEPSTIHRTARSAGASTSQEDVAKPFEHTSGTRKRSHMAMAVEEDEDDDEDEPVSRKKIPRIAAYIDLTESEDEAAPANVVDLTGSERGSSDVPHQQAQDSYLHRLPGELRNRIYRHVVLVGPRMELQNLEEPALAVAIPDLKDEVHSFMLSANRLRVPVYTAFRADVKPHYSKKKSKKDDFGDFNNSHTAPGQVGIAPDSWVMQVDPRYVTIKYICLRILESHVSASGHKHLCDYFLNVSCKDGNMKVSGRTIMEATKVFKRTINHMSCLATERAKQFAQREGFEGFNWEQVKHIAASFVSVADAKLRYTKKNARVMLLEEMN